MTINKIASWDLPEGLHKGKIIDARIIETGVKGREKSELRFLIECLSRVHPTKKFMANRILYAGDSAQIVADFEELLGDKILQVINLEGQIIPQGLELLIDMRVDFEIEHFQGKTHKKPFCHVSRIAKSGTLIELIKDKP